MYRSSFVEQVQGHQCISTRPLPPLSKNFRNLPLVGHANRPHMRRGHGGAYLSYGKVRQTYRGAPCRISGSGDRRKGARGRIPRGHSCAFCVSSLYLTSPKTIEMTDWAPVWEMYMEFSIYRLDYISSVYIHTHVGLVSAVPGALVTTRPWEDRAYNSLHWVSCTVRVRVINPFHGLIYIDNSLHWCRLHCIHCSAGEVIYHTWSLSATKGRY